MRGDMSDAARVQGDAEAAELFALWLRLLGRDKP